uniref:DUF5641 domain-containing protein n=1 Tax=Globodera rostochiensis TaxID=31243 RepID=A0A914H8X6_GLORO
MDVEAQNNHEFWKTWSTEYLPVLRERPSQHRDPKNKVIGSPKLGELVQIDDGTLLKGNWKLGKVTEIKSPRAVELQLGDGSRLIRPVAHLCSLEIQQPAIEQCQFTSAIEVQGRRAASRISGVGHPFIFTLLTLVLSLNGCLSQSAMLCPASDTGLYWKVKARKTLCANFSTDPPFPTAHRFNLYRPNIDLLSVRAAHCSQIQETIKKSASGCGNTGSANTGYLQGAPYRKERKTSPTHRLPTGKSGCHRRLAESEQGYAVPLNQFRLLMAKKGRRTKRTAEMGRVFTNQLGAQLTASQFLSAESLRKVLNHLAALICSKGNNFGFLEGIISGTDANTVARALASSPYIKAKWLSKELMEIRHCIPIPLRNITFRRQGQSVEESCEDHQYSTIFIEGELIKVNQRTGLFRLIKEEEIHELTVGEEVTHFNEAAIKPHAFGNFIITNYTDPRIDVLQMLQDFRLDKRFEQEQLGEQARPPERALGRPTGRLLRENILALRRDGENDHMELPSLPVSSNNAVHKDAFGADIGGAGVSHKCEGSEGLRENWSGN